MNYQLSKTSKRRLATCDERLQEIINEAIKITPIDFGVACGHRTPEEQMECFKAGTSKLDGINHLSKHNHSPSLAVDIYGYNNKALWDEKTLSILAGVILSIAIKKGFKIEWGGNWKSFKDYPHFEII